MENRKPKVAEEVAEQDFERFCDCMDLNFDPKKMDQEDLKGFEQNKARVIAAIMTGSLVVDANGIPTYTPTMSDCGPLVFNEPSGAAFLAMDGKKKGADMGKTYAVLAEITGQPQNVFAKMKNRDMKVCQALFTLFLA